MKKPIKYFISTGKYKLKIIEQIEPHQAAVHFFLVLIKYTHKLFK